MVAETTTNPFDELEAQLASDDAFKPTEMFSLNEIVSVQTVAAPEAWLRARRVDPDSADFRAHFPTGQVPVLEIALRGIDKDYAFAEDHILRILVPMVATDGNNIGQPKGERSQLHIVSEAFQKVFNVKPFGAANREKLVGRKARWGQHIDSFENPDTKQKQSYRWDIPRQELPPDFVYTGDVRVIQAKATGGGSNGATPAGVSQELSEDAAVFALLRLVVGKHADDIEDLCEQALEIRGLPGKWVNAAANRQLLAELHGEGHIDQELGVIVEKK